MQPFSAPPNIPQHQTSQSDYMDQLLPSDPQLTAMPPSFSSNINNGPYKQQQQQQQKQSGPDFSQMYQTQNTPLVGANQLANTFEPSAANDGGSPFSSW